MEDLNSKRNLLNNFVNMIWSSEWRPNRRNDKVIHILQGFERCDLKQHKSEASQEAKIGDLDFLLNSLLTRKAWVFEPRDESTLGKGW